MVAALAAAALPVVVVNPRQVRDFAKATGQLAKTDALDARAVARFAGGAPHPASTARCADRACAPWWRGAANLSPCGRLSTTASAVRPVACGRISRPISPGSISVWWLSTMT